MLRGILHRKHLLTWIYFLSTGILRAEPSPPGPKIIILWAGFGNGHKSAAESIAAQILQTQPHAKVAIKDALDFMNPYIRKQMVEGYNSTTRHSPESYDHWFNKMTSTVEHVESVGDMPVVSQYELSEASLWLKKNRPSVILSTFNHATELMVRLRNMGALPPDLKIAWQHTDYVDLPYFAQISKEIDMTFLGHPELKEAWIHRHQVPSDKVLAPGLAVSAEVRAPFSTQERGTFLVEHGLDPLKKTFTLMSGANAVGNFPKVIESLAKNISQPFQIVAITAKNQGQYAALQKLKKSLPPHVDLKVEGFVEHKDLLRYIKSSDLFIGKAGGLSSTEAFVMGVPTLFLDNNGGQERHNIRFFENLHLGRGVREESQVGPLVRELLANPATLEKWRHHQTIFRTELGETQPIADWILKASQDFTRTHPLGATVGFADWTLRSRADCLSRALYLNLKVNP